MAIIYKKQPTVFLENEKKEDKKKPTGLGRSFDSLLDDNSTAYSSKSSIVKRNGSYEKTEKYEQTRSSDDLYKKEGVLNVQKSKRIR